MNSRLEKKTINELQVGMFIVEMDISWIKSPFLLHRRAIKSKHDIALLKKFGVKIVTIDWDKSHIQTTQNDTESGTEKNGSPEHTDAHNESVSAQEFVPEFSPENLDKPSVLLNEELNRAVVLKEQANEAFKQANELVKNNEPISAEEFEPVIDETISSLLRNSQALLTLMHLQRYENRLFSHSFSVMTLALTFAIKEGVNKEDLKILGMAALLHDIGWAQLPLNLLGKAKKYTNNEQKVVQQHQKIANIIVGKSESVPESAKNLMMMHHERNDGSGYPDGLHDFQLNKLAKILILSDYYDETLHGLLDRPGLIPSETLRLLYKEAVQKKFNKSHVESLIKLLGIYPLTSAVELNSGEKGIVVEVNREKPLTPVVKIMYSRNGNALATPLIVDLDTDKKNRHIKGVVDYFDEKNDPLHLLVFKKA